MGSGKEGDTLAHIHKALSGSGVLYSVLSDGHSPGFRYRDCPGCRAEARQQKAWEIHEAYTAELEKIQARKKEA